MPEILQRLKERKLFQWAAAYLGGAWLFLQLLDVVGERWGMSPALGRAFDALLVLGFFTTLVLAWYHGEQGRQRVSGVELLILAVLLGVGGGALHLIQASGAEQMSTGESAQVELLPPMDHRLSVAILPFENLSDDPAAQYFSDGISEEILNALVAVPGLRVPSRTSTFSFRNRDISIRELAAELDVDHVLTGTPELIPTSGPERTNES